jgi:hypothetical protein
MMIKPKIREKAYFAVNFDGIIMLSKNKTEEVKHFMETDFVAALNKNGIEASYISSATNCDMQGNLTIMIGVEPKKAHLFEPFKNYYLKEYNYDKFLKK